jgi:hypothetical protein
MSAGSLYPEGYASSCHVLAREPENYAASRQSKFATSLCFFAHCEALRTFFGECWKKQQRVWQCGCERVRFVSGKADRLFTYLVAVPTVSCRAILRLSWFNYARTET